MKKYKSLKNVILINNYKIYNCYQKCWLVMTYKYVEIMNSIKKLQTSKRLDLSVDTWMDHSIIYIYKTVILTNNNDLI